MTQLGYDNFTRADQTGFGAASDGVNTWSSDDFGTASSNIKTNQGEFSTVAVLTGVHLGTATSRDGHIFATFSMSAVTTGFAFVMLRQTSASTYYRARQSGTTLFIERVNAGTATVLASVAFTVTAATKYNLRFEIIGGDTPSLRANIWAFGTAEPLTSGGIAWLIPSTADAAPITGAGTFGIGSKPNGVSATVDFTQFWCVDYLFAESLPVADSFSGVVGYMPTEALSATDTPLMSDGYSPVEALSGTDLVSALQAWNVDALTATDSALFADSAIPVEALGSNDVFLSQATSLAIDALSATDLQSALQAWGVDALLVSDATLFAQSVLATDTLSIMDGYLATDGATWIEVGSAADSMSGTDGFVPLETLTPSDAFSGQESFIPTDALSGVDVTLFTQTTVPIEALTLVDSLIAADGYTPIEHLSAADSLLGLDSYGATDSVPVADAFLSQQAGLFVEVDPTSDTLAVGQVGAFTDTLPAGDTLLAQNTSQWTDVTPMGDALLAQDGYSPSDTLSALDAYLAQSGGIWMDVIAATDSLLASGSYLPSDGLSVGDRLLSQGGYLPTESLFVADLQSALQSWGVDALVIMDTFSQSCAFVPMETLGVAESVLATDSALFLEGLSVTDLFVGLVVHAQAAIAPYVTLVTFRDGVTIATFRDGVVQTGGR